MSLDLVWATDAAFVTPTMVAIGSVLHHLTQPANARVFVVDGGIDPLGRSRLEQYVFGAGADLQILAVPAGALVPEAATGHISTATYLRLLAPQLVPDNVTRLLYLDGDVLAAEGLEPLSSIDLAGRALGAVRDFEVPLVSSPGGIASWRQLGLDPGAPYVNAGVLVIDVARWRELGLGERALEDQRRHRTVTGDQGSLNVVAQGEVTLLDPRWNAQGSLLHLDLFAQSPHKEALLRRRDELLSRPAIIHFVGPHKPWHPTCRHPGAVEWRRHAAALGAVSDTRPVTQARTRPLPTALERPILSVVLPWERGATATDGDVTVTVADSCFDVEVVVAAVVGEDPPRSQAPLVRSVDAGQDQGVGNVWRTGYRAAAGSGVLFAPVGVDLDDEVVATIRQAFGHYPEAGALLLRSDDPVERPLGRLELLDLLRDIDGSRPTPEQIVFRRGALRHEDFARDLLDGFIEIHLLLALARRVPVITVPFSPPCRTAARRWPDRRYAALAGSQSLAAHQLRLHIGLERLRSMLPARPSAVFVDELTTSADAVGEAIAELVPLLGTTPQQRRARLGTLLAGVDPRAVVAFADDDMWCPETIGGVQVVPFPSVHGVFAGLPANDQEALDGLDSACSEGIDHLGFPASSRWWLSHYPVLADALRRNWRPVVDEPALVVYARQQRRTQRETSS